MHKSKLKSTLDFVSCVCKAALKLFHTSCPTFDIDKILIITDGLPLKYVPVITTLDNMPFENLKLLDVTSQILGLEAQIVCESPELTGHFARCLPEVDRYNIIY